MLGFAGVVAVPDFFHFDILIRPRNTKLKLCCGKFEGGVGQFGSQANTGLWNKRENFDSDPIFYHYS